MWGRVLQSISKFVDLKGVVLPILAEYLARLILKFYKKK